MRIIQVALAAFAAALGLTLVAVGPAHADPSSYTWCEETNDAGEHGGKVCWVDDGDTWWVCDIDQDDSQHAVGDYWLEIGGSWVKKGHEEDDASGTDGCDQGPDNAKPANGQRFRVRICLQNGDGPLTGCDYRIDTE